MHIAMVVTNSCDPDPRVIAQASWLKDEGHLVDVHAFDRIHESEPEVIEGSLRIIRHRLGKVAYGGLLRTANGKRKFRNAMVRTLSANKFDAIVCHDADTLAIGTAIKRRQPSIRLVFDMHDLQHTWIMMHRTSLFRRMAAAWMKRTMLAAAQKCDIVLTSSEGLNAWLTEHGIASQVIENRPRAHTNIPDLPMKYTVGYLGRIRELEPFHHLITAIEGLDTGRRPDILLAGDGVMAEQVDQMLAERTAMLGVDYRYHGPFQHSELPKLMAEISVMFAMYSPHRENIARGALPTKMFDAAAFGRASIVNDGTPMGEVCTSESLGYVCAWNDADALATILDEQPAPEVRLQRDAEDERITYLHALTQRA